MHRPRHALTNYASGKAWAIWILKDGCPAVTGPESTEIRLDMDPRDLADDLPRDSAAPSVDAYCHRLYASRIDENDVAHSKVI